MDIAPLLQTFGRVLAERAAERPKQEEWEAQPPLTGALGRCVQFGICVSSCRGKEHLYIPALSPIALQVLPCCTPKESALSSLLPDKYEGLGRLGLEAFVPFVSTDDRHYKVPKTRFGFPSTRRRLEAAVSEFLAVEESDRLFIKVVHAKRCPQLAAGAGHCPYERRGREYLQWLETREQQQAEAACATEAAAYLGLAMVVGSVCGDAGVVVLLCAVILYHLVLANKGMDPTAPAQQDEGDDDDTPEEVQLCVRHLELFGHGGPGGEELPPCHQVDCRWLGARRVEGSAGLERPTTRARLHRCLFRHPPQGGHGDKTGEGEATARPPVVVKMERDGADMSALMCTGRECGDPYARMLETHQHDISDFSTALHEIARLVVQFLGYHALSSGFARRFVPGMQSVGPSMLGDPEHIPGLGDDLLPQGAEIIQALAAHVRTTRGFTFGQGLFTRLFWDPEYVEEWLLDFIMSVLPLSLRAFLRQSMPTLLGRLQAEFPSHVQDVDQDPTSAGSVAYLLGSLFDSAALPMQLVWTHLMTMGVYHQLPEDPHPEMAAMKRELLQHGFDQELIEDVEQSARQLMDDPRHVALNSPLQLHHMFALRLYTASSEVCGDMRWAALTGNRCSWFWTSYVLSEGINRLAAAPGGAINEHEEVRLYHGLRGCEWAPTGKRRELRDAFTMTTFISTAQDKQVAIAFATGEHDEGDTSVGCVLEMVLPPKRFLPHAADVTWISPYDEGEVLLAFLPHLAWAQDALRIRDVTRQCLNGVDCDVVTLEVGGAHIWRLAHSIFRGQPEFAEAAFFRAYQQLRGEEAGIAELTGHCALTGMTPWMEATHWGMPQVLAFFLKPRLVPAVDLRLTTWATRRSIAGCNIAHILVQTPTAEPELRDEVTPETWQRVFDLWDEALEELGLWPTLLQQENANGDTPWQQLLRQRQALDEWKGAWERPRPADEEWTPAQDARDRKMLRESWQQQDARCRKLEELFGKRRPRAPAEVQLADDLELDVD